MPSIQHSSYSAFFDLTSLLDEVSAGIDPEFDAEEDDLAWEFAEARLSFGNE